MFKIDISIISLSTFLIIGIQAIGQTNSTTVNQTHSTSVRAGSMTASWNVNKNQISFIIKAPTNGWVAMGINDKEQLSGTNLIMGASEHGFYKLEDQYIVGIGNHQSILKLGGNEAILYRNVQENNGQTILQVTIPLESTDSFHHNLQQGKSYYLLLAWSVSDDFGHHSRYRTFKKITL